MQVIFEKTWEETLSDKQKQAFIKKYSMKDMVNRGFTASPILLKKKRNGGLVATVFLQNNSSALLSLNEISAHIENDSGDKVAEEHFVLSLEIPPFTATPWSLIFSPDHVNTGEEPLDSWRVAVK